MTAPRVDVNGRALPPDAPDDAVVSPINGAWIVPRKPGEGWSPESVEAMARRNTWSRKAVRQRLVDLAGDNVKQLQDWIEGRAKILVGFRNQPELAETFYTIFAEKWAKQFDPDATRFQPWASLSDEEKTVWMASFEELTGGKLTMREIATKIGVVGQQQAWKMAAEYGLGYQNANVDDEGNAVGGVVALPPLDLDVARRRRDARIAAEQANETVIEEHELEYVEEDIVAAVSEHEDIAPPELEARVRPEVVEIIRRRRQGKHSNGNGVHED